MPPRNATVILEIEKLVYGGDGLSRLPEDEAGRRMAVFVPFTLPGEKIEAVLVPSKSTFARGELQQVLVASPDRERPTCPYFTICGGCHLQHGSYKLQLDSKLEVLRESLSRSGIVPSIKFDTLASSPWRYRNRIRMHIQHRPHFQIGYLERRSHQQLPVDQCPIAMESLERTFLKLQENPLSFLVPEEVTEIELFTNQDQLELTFAVWCLNPRQDFPARFFQWISACLAQFPALQGASAFAERGRGQSQTVIARAGSPALTYRVGEHPYRVSAGAFFQVNAYLLDALIQRVVAAITPSAGSTAWDLYAGVGLFSCALATAGAAVTAVEAAPLSGDDLTHNLRQTGSGKVIRATTETFLEQSRSQSTRRPQAIVVDPPRTGLGKSVTQHLARISAPTLVYLSCDPATLARDLKPLLESGYELVTLTLVDLFPQTFHIETLAVLRHS